MSSRIPPPASPVAPVRSVDDDETLHSGTKSPSDLLDAGAVYKRRKSGSLDEDAVPAWAGAKDAGSRRRRGYDVDGSRRRGHGVNLSNLRGGHGVNAIHRRICVMATASM